MTVGVSVCSRGLSYASVWNSPGIIQLIPGLLCFLAYEYFPPRAFIPGLLPGPEWLVRFGERRLFFFTEHV